MRDDAPPRIVVPADIDTPDTIAWGLSFRQLGILGGANGALWVAYSQLGPLLPPAAWVLLVFVVFPVSIVAALGRRDGLPVDVWLRHGLALTRTPRVSTPGRPEPGPPLLTTRLAKPPAPLREAVTSINEDGRVQVGPATRYLLACGTTNLNLRSPAEQESLLDGFGQWLNALSSAAQITISSARHDLSPHAEAVMQAAPGLGHHALRAAAADHAAFLLDLDATREPLRRHVLLTTGADLTRETSVRALSALGISVEPLDGQAVTAALTAAVDPYASPVNSPRAIPGVPVTARSRRT
jgi:PrgI family protein